MKSNKRRNKMLKYALGTKESALQTLNALILNNKSQIEIRIAHEIYQDLLDDEVNAAAQTKGA